MTEETQDVLYSHNKRIRANALEIRAMRKEIRELKRNVNLLIELAATDPRNERSTVKQLTLMETEDD